MNIGDIEGCTRILGQEQGYRGLPISDVKLNCTVGGEETPAMQSAWFPSEEELHALNNGAPIILTVVGQVHPPVSMDIGSLV